MGIALRTRLQLNKKTKCHTGQSVEGCKDAKRLTAMIQAQKKSPKYIESRKEKVN